jgi:hypothetical protein
LDRVGIGRWIGADRGWPCDPQKQDADTRKGCPPQPIAIAPPAATTDAMMSQAHAYSKIRRSAQCPPQVVNFRGRPRLCSSRSSPQAWFLDAISMPIRGKTICLVTNALHRTVGSTEADETTLRNAECHSGGGSAQQPISTIRCVSRIHSKRLLSLDFR